MQRNQHVEFLSVKPGGKYRVGFQRLGCRAFVAIWVIILGFIDQNVVIGAFDVILTVHRR